jgi:hypothetical protein
MEYAKWLHSFHNHGIGLPDAQRYISQGAMEWVMSKPLSDSTSYGHIAHAIQMEKWDLILEGFDRCLKENVFTVRNNPLKRASTILVTFEGNYSGALNGLFSDFFSKTMGAITRAWVTTAAEDAVGGGQVTKSNGVRISAYSELYKYYELKRRATIVCNGGTLPGFKPMSAFHVDNYVPPPSD